LKIIKKDVRTAIFYILVNVLLIISLTAFTIIGPKS
jgi:hypothetical protein